MRRTDAEEVPSPPAGRFQFRVGALLLVTAAVAVGCVAIYRWYRHISQPAAIRVLEAHEEEILAYIDSINAGRVPLREHGRGYYLLDVLAEGGASYVRKESDCIVITFYFMPTDAVPQLIYSPAGFEPLPPPVRELKSRNGFFELTRVKEKWAYCRWDQ